MTQNYVLALDDLRTARSMMFVPADRPERFERALKSGADAVVVDLEDAVPATNKHFANQCVIDLLTSYEGPVPVVVRIDDMATARLLGQARKPCAIMVPKAERADDLTEVSASLPTGSVLLPLIETATGVLDVRTLSETPGVLRLVLGHLDLSAQLGLDPDDRPRLAPARFALVAASAASGLPGPVDGVTTSVRDTDLVHRDTLAAVADGYTGKLSIHPAQVPVIHAALRPKPEEVAWARRVVDSVGPSAAIGTVDGQMVDRPVLLRAKALLARAALTEPSA